MRASLASLLGHHYPLLHETYINFHYFTILVLWINFTVFFFFFSSSGSEWPCNYYTDKNEVMTFWSSCLYHSSIVWCQSSNSGLCACSVSTLPTTSPILHCYLETEKAQWGNLSTWRSLEYSMTLKAFISKVATDIFFLSVTKQNTKKGMLTNTWKMAVFLLHSNWWEILLSEKLTCRIWIADSIFYCFLFSAHYLANMKLSNLPNRFILTKIISIILKAAEGITYLSLQGRGHYLPLHCSHVPETDTSALHLQQQLIYTIFMKKLVTVIYLYSLNVPFNLSHENTPK